MLVRAVVVAVGKDSGAADDPIRISDIAIYTRAVASVTPVGSLTDAEARAEPKSEASQQAFRAHFLLKHSKADAADGSNTAKLTSGRPQLKSQRT